MVETDNHDRCTTHSQYMDKSSPFFSFFSFPFSLFFLFLIFLISSSRARKATLHLRTFLSTRNLLNARAVITLPYPPLHHERSRLLLDSCHSWRGFRDGDGRCETTGRGCWECMESWRVGVGGYVMDVGACGVGGSLLDFKLVRWEDGERLHWGREGWRICWDCIMEFEEFSKGKFAQD